MVAPGLPAEPGARSGRVIDMTLAAQTAAA
jgi:hypothetical protein